MGKFFPSADTTFAPSLRLTRHPPSKKRRLPADTGRRSKIRGSTGGTHSGGSAEVRGGRPVEDPPRRDSRRVDRGSRWVWFVLLYKIRDPSHRVSTGLAETRRVFAHSE